MFAADSPPVEVHGLQAFEPPREGTTQSRSPSVDPEGESLVAPAPPLGTASTGGPFFNPWGEDDVFDVFDLELVVTSGGRDAMIDVRCRSGDSSSGRPTYKIQKKTRAHFLGKKNMTVDVSRSLGWDPVNATPTGSRRKGYVNVFSAIDQPSRSVSLIATDSVFSLSSNCEVIAVSSGCGDARPCPPDLRETPAHHFFELKLTDRGAPARPVHMSNKRVVPAPPAPPPSGIPYEGGGHFVLQSGPPERSDLLSTLYSTRYEQRQHVRLSDIVVAELRVGPAPAALGPWARFIKLRHASLHVSRRGLDACLTGPHVGMQLRDEDATLRAALSRGQALEVMLAALGTAVLAIEHDGLDSKHWAWLTLPPAPALVGPASPNGESESTVGRPDDSQGPTAGSLAAFEHGNRPAGLHAGTRGLYSPSMVARRSSISGYPSAEGIELDEWTATADVRPPLPTCASAQEHGSLRKGTLARKSTWAWAWARRKDVNRERPAPPPPALVAAAPRVRELAAEERWLAVCAKAQDRQLPAPPRAWRVAGHAESEDGHMVG